MRIIRGPRWSPRRDRSLTHKWKLITSCSSYSMVHSAGKTFVAEKRGQIQCRIQGGYRTQDDEKAETRPVAIRQAFNKDSSQAEGVQEYQEFHGAIEQMGRVPQLELANEDSATTASSSGRAGPTTV